MNLEYVVVMTISSPRGIRPKEYLPLASGLDWGKGRASFCGDGWLEYRVEQVLTQVQLDAVARQVWMNIDATDSGGIYKPSAFPNSLIPASVWYGESFWDTTAYRFYICPFPAGLEDRGGYEFEDYEEHTGWMGTHYKQLIEDMQSEQRQQMEATR